MDFKTITTVLSDESSVADVLDLAIPFVQENAGHLDVCCLAVDRTQTGYYYAGASAVVHDMGRQAAEAELERIESAAKEILGRSDVAYAIEALVAPSVSVTPIVARRARFADLVIMPKPYGPDVPEDAPIAIEAALFQGRAPVLVLGGTGPIPAQPGQVVIAWNESAESLRAVRAALPMLKRAELVEIFILDPRRYMPDIVEPGSELATMLARHGIKTEITVAAQSLPRVSDSISRHLTDRSAELLVMGAYSHSRFREAILGGTTRNLLESAEVPVLMAH